MCIRYIDNEETAIVLIVLLRIENVENQYTKTMEDKMTNGLVYFMKRAPQKFVPLYAPIVAIVVISKIIIR